MRSFILKYNHAEVLNKATELFWQKGYQGTKMRDLQEHLDMRPGSIYAGFGSKEAIFLQVFGHALPTTRPSRQTGKFVCLEKARPSPV